MEVMSPCKPWTYSSHLSGNVCPGVQVLEEGALQPVIGLLSSSCTESQRESALLLGQFATTDHEFKAKIVQRGAVPPLITMLGSSDVQLKEMAAFALGRLAQNVDNQAGIVQVLLRGRSSSCLAGHAAGCVDATLLLLNLTLWTALQSGDSVPLEYAQDAVTHDWASLVSSAVHAHAQAGGLPPLLELMASRNGNLQHNAAFALYGLADNEDNIAAIVRQGGVQCLQDCELLVQVWGHQCCLDHHLCDLCCEVTAGSLEVQQERPSQLLWCCQACTVQVQTQLAVLTSWAQQSADRGARVHH